MKITLGNKSRTFSQGIKHCGEDLHSRSSLWQDHRIFLKVRDKIGYFLIVLFLSFFLSVIAPPFLREAGDFSKQAVTVNNDLPQSEPLQIATALPISEGEKIVSFGWKYKGKGYSLDDNLYESYYQFYRAFPMPLFSNSQSRIDYETQRNELFLTEMAGDNAIETLAKKIRELGEKYKLNENQLVEFVAAFVETIPYDQGKLDRRKSGLNGMTEKITFPYEVLYENTGVCQDKSYLAYALLKELGYGVTIFLFPDPKDNHMAIGVKCPLQYSNYESGYCFLETTSLGNKIGMIPDLIPQSRIATSDVKINTVDNNQVEDDQYQPLGNVEVLNKIDGKEYTGIVDTINIQKRLEQLRKTIDGYNKELKSLGAEIKNEEDDLDKMKKKLESLKKAEQYTEYNDLVNEYNDLLSQVKKDVKTYNKKVSISNDAVEQYRILSKDFYR